jgi:hypothetical protein
MASTVSKKRFRTTKSTTRQPHRTMASIDEAHLKDLMKQAVREVMEELEDAWDRQIAADVAAGRLDSLINEATKEIQTGKTEPLDPDHL